MGTCCNKDCVFCKILRNEEERELIYEDEVVFAFQDINKRSAREHILVCPKEHIPNVNSLNTDHIPLLNHMKVVGQKILKEIDPNAGTRLGFHVPPFYSVDHLHLHLIMEPVREYFPDKWLFAKAFMRDLDTQISLLQQLKKTTPKL
jgi:diadenosine tetraphosphate (Ap4A) HIT family hydrolase